MIGWASLGMSLLLALSELLARHRRRMKDWDFLDALIIGICQAGALIPGVSRSGSTLTAALFLDFKRAEAARFSFLLGLPAITLAGLKELFELRHAGLDAHGWSVLCRGPRRRQHFGLRGNMEPLAHFRTVFGVGRS